MRTFLTRDFWDYAGERAIKTFAQTALATIGVDAIGILNVDFAAVGSAGALAALLSLLTSITAAESEKRAAKRAK